MKRTICVMMEGTNRRLELINSCRQICSEKLINLFFIDNKKERREIFHQSYLTVRVSENVEVLLNGKEKISLESPLCTESMLTKIYKIACSDKKIQVFSSRIFKMNAEKTEVIIDGENLDLMDENYLCKNNGHLFPQIIHRNSSQMVMELQMNHKKFHMDLHPGLNHFFIGSASNYDIKGCPMENRDLIDVLLGAVCQAIVLTKVFPEWRERSEQLWKWLFKIQEIYVGSDLDPNAPDVIFSSNVGADFFNFHKGFDNYLKMYGSTMISWEKFMKIFRLKIREMGPAKAMHMYMQIQMQMQMKFYPMKGFKVIAADVNSVTLSDSLVSALPLLFLIHARFLFGKQFSKPDPDKTEQFNNICQSMEKMRFEEKYRQRLRNHLPDQILQSDEKMEERIISM